MVPPVSLDLFNFQATASSWRHVLPNAFGGLFFYKANNFWSQEEVIFLHTEPDFDYPAGWRPVRPLGKGGYGMVGLWQRFDDTGQVVDSIAIKQQQYNPNPDHQEKMQVGFNGLAMEAALMEQLNRDANPNIITLKGFKNNLSEKLWRFYFEFAPWGDLHVLKHNYAAWNTYFPEEFLWHIFHGLANAALKMEVGPFQDFVTRHIYEPQTAFVLHLDLKPGNLFVGDALDDKPYHFSNYPTIKVGDFGLAQLSGPNDMRNPVRFRWCGTTGYRPPVRLPHELLWTFCANHGLGA